MFLAHHEALATSPAIANGPLSAAAARGETTLTAGRLGAGNCEAAAEAGEQGAALARETLQCFVGCVRDVLSLHDATLRSLPATIEGGKRRIAAGGGGGSREAAGVRDSAGSWHGVGDGPAASAPKVDAAAGVTLLDVWCHGDRMRQQLQKLCDVCLCSDAGPRQARPAAAAEAGCRCREQLCAPLRGGGSGLLGCWEMQRRLDGLGIPPSRWQRAEEEGEDGGLLSDGAALLDGLYRGADVERERGLRGRRTGSG